MPLILSEVKEASEFDSIWPMLFKAYQNPYNPLFKHFNSIRTTEESALQESKERHVQWWESSSTCHWLRVIDDEIEEVIAAACWQVPGKNIEEQRGEEDRNGTQESFDAYWHEKGSVEKQFAEKLIGENLIKFTIDKMKGQRYCELDQVVTHPSHRNRGAARMLIKWGTDIADQLKLGCVIGSTPFARPAYERCGFTTVARIEPNMSIENPNEKWKEYEAEDLHAYMMWRPIRRVLTEEQDKVASNQ